MRRYLHGELEIIVNASPLICVAHQTNLKLTRFHKRNNRWFADDSERFPFSCFSVTKDRVSP